MFTNSLSKAKSQRLGEVADMICRWPRWALRAWFRPKLRLIRPGQLCCSEVLAEERKTLSLQDEPPVAGAALCLSGGGVRSAALSLGILQALAEQGALTRFNWLSTVSGGGYAGGWLQAWINNAHNDAASVERALGGPAEAPEVKRLREWCNFLTPNPGLQSLDTWTNVTLWVRNMLVNWLVFGPILLAVATVPLITAHLLSEPGRVPSMILLAVAASALLVGTLVSCAYLPSHVENGGKPSRAVGPDQPVQPRKLPFQELNERGVGTLVIAPALVWAILVPCYWRQALRPPLHTARHVGKHDLLLHAKPGFFSTAPLELLTIPAITVAILIGGYLAIMLLGFRPRRVDPSSPNERRVRKFNDERKLQRSVYLTNLRHWAVASLASAAGLCAGGILSTGLSANQLAVLGPPWVIGSHLVQTMIYVALRQDPVRGDLDREWLARVSALKAMISLAWIAFAATVLLLPDLSRDPSGVSQWTSMAYRSVGAAFVGGLAALLGKSPRTIGTDLLAHLRTRLTRSLDNVLSLFTIVFIVLLFSSLGELASIITTWSRTTFGAPTPSGAGLASSSALFIVAGRIGWWMAKTIDVNRFSLHASYRNRLSRAFLGSTMREEERRAEPLTGFDPFDNPRIKDLLPKKDGKVVLLPIINTTLNLGSGSRWSERKGRPFTITPLHCGFGEPPPGRLAFMSIQVKRITPSVPLPRMGNYVRTENYGGQERETGWSDRNGGMTLATAITLSGAAVSPAMGYHSRPATAFLMTLFNVRLGAWRPNPARASRDELKRGKPPVLSLLFEMLGHTVDTGKAIYLTDGGHFENLGLYEALRRHPALIVVVDATNDPKYQYADLGASLRKALTDFDVVVNFPASFQIGKPPENGWVEATIAYPDVALTPTATLIYIKASKPPCLPPELAQYAAFHQDFPHTPTLQQFFEETQFESYRALGRLLGQQAAPALRSALNPTRFAVSL